MTNIQNLKKGQLISVQGSLNLAVKSGIVWVTFENNSQDYVLESEQKIHQTQEGLAVIEAIEDSIVLYTYSLQEEPEFTIEATHEGALSIDPLLRRSTLTGDPSAIARACGDHEQF